MLRPGVSYELTGAAIEGIQRLKLRDTLPDLKLLAFSTNAAIDAVITLADRKEATKLLLALLDSPTDLSTRCHAMLRLGQGRHRVAVPKLLDALEDSSGLVRESADRALRLLAGAFAHERREALAEARRRERRLEALTHLRDLSSPQRPLAVE